MAARIGLNAKLYINGNEVTNCRDLTLTMETATADATTRGNNGWRATIATLKDMTLEYETVADSDDANFVAVQEAFLNGTSLSAAALDADDGEGPQATCMVTTFNRNEPLEDVITYSVTLKPTYDPINPPEWITGGYGA